MDHYSVQEAQRYLEKLMMDARQGKTVVIVDEENGAVQLVPVSSERRKAGSAKGRVKIAPSFDEPLADFDAYSK